MPIITIQMIEGRTLEQKRELVKAITEDVVRIAKTSPERVQVFMTEYPKENVSRQGILRVDQDQ